VCVIAGTTQTACFRFLSAAAAGCTEDPAGTTALVGGLEPAWFHLLEKKERTFFTYRYV